MSSRTLLPSLFFLPALFLVACRGGTGPGVQDDAGCQGAGCETMCTTPPCDEEVAVIPTDINRDIDVLFMVDNSGSMIEEQASLQANFSRFISVLSSVQGGLPNLHIGVVSSDVGGATAIAGCEGTGDGGQLQSTPTSQGCSAPSDSYIVDIADPATGGRTTNYSGSLADTFSCIAGLGNQGCGFEQPLESMKLALADGANPGFLRDDAWLVLVIMSDEDDCSAKDPALYSADESDPLGPLSSFRCFEFGVVCDSDEPRVPGDKSGCVSREDSAYLRSVQSYVDFFKGLKADPTQVIVAGIIGNPNPVSVSIDGDTGNPTLDKSCVSSSGEAVPGIRLAQFLSSFPDRSTSSTICNEDLSSAITVVAEKVADSLGSPCLEGAISAPFDCSVADVSAYGEANEERTELPVCNAASSPTNQPCYIIEQDLEHCGDTDSNLTVRVERSEPPPAGSSIVVTCKVDPAL